MTEKPMTSPQLPWKTKIIITLLSAVTDATRRRDGTVNRFLSSFFDSRAAANPEPLHGVKTADFTVDASRNLWFRLFYPTDDDIPDDIPVIVFFHGGGFAFLSPDAKAYDFVCRRIAHKILAAVVSVNYRLAPEHKCPAAYEDGFDVLRWLDGRPKQFSDFAPNADVSRMFLMGDSAGGNLAHHVAERISANPTSDLQKVRVIGLVSVQPFFGGEERTPAEDRLVRAPLVSVERADWMWRSFLPEGSDRDHEAVNVFGPRCRAVITERYPATLVFVGGFDPLQDWQKRYYEGLKARGREAYLVEYPDAVHAFYIFPELPQAGMLLTETRDFVLKQCGKISLGKEKLHGRFRSCCNEPRELDSHFVLLILGGER
ncbi:hypothetical protein AAC387_Pa04g2471 [Persea americana]